MGLDQYLTAEHYIADWKDESKDLIDGIKSNAPDGLNDFTPTNVTFRLAYWRKANAIHSWFVKNVQGGKDECQTSYVPLESLKVLKETCEKVLANLELGPELLPSQGGFFFGSTEYDDWYKTDLENTITKLDKILSNPNAEKWWIQYHASW